MWKKEIPTKAGSYWYYGDAFTLNPEKSYQYALRHVFVRKISNGFMYVADGNFMECFDGFWMENTTPELPLISE